ncbi:MAG: hypothetical protein ACR2OI_01145 [Acidimicrobiia bacterium]
MALLLNRTSRLTEPTKVLVDCDGRAVSVELTDAAASQLARLESPVVAEMEILFSCLVRKQVVFRPPVVGETSYPVVDGLSLAVRPVLYELCEPAPGETEPPVVDFDVVSPEQLLPRSVRIDADDDHLVGTFSFS